MIADKIHHQFAHAPVDKLIRLLNNAGPPWCEDKELKDHLKSTVRECKTCKLYKKPLPTPVAAMPLAFWFQQTVAMDLKFYQGKIILHLIDHATRLSAAVQIPSKHPKAIIKTILSNWISVYGAAENFLTDNGGEFENQDFIQLCEAFNISVKTTGAEAPWSNGLVERHNLALSEMLNKVLEDTKCPFDIALQWCMNAKNSLHNVHRFSLYQLALGQNPKLPSLLNNKLPAYGSNPPSEIIRQNLNTLHIARNSFIQSENSERLHRAMAHNIRHSNNSVFVTGDLEPWHTIYGILMILYLLQVTMYITREQMIPNGMVPVQL